MSDDHAVREAMWLNHGHSVSGLYGDDGEMQCPLCKQMDYRREPLEVLYRQAATAFAAHVRATSLKAAEDALAALLGVHLMANSDFTMTQRQVIQHCISLIQNLNNPLIAPPPHLKVIL